MKHKFVEQFPPFLVLQVVISLQKSRIYASLSTVKFFIREDPSAILQTPYYTSPSTAWIVSEDEKISNHHFNEVCNRLVNPVFGEGNPSDV